MIRQRFEASVQLPRGITGFRDFGEPPLPECDVVVFQRCCYAVARRFNGSVQSVEIPKSGSNFLRGLMKLGADAIGVVLNRHYPLIAFTSRNEDGHEICFIDSSQLAEAFVEFGNYEVLSSTELAKSISLDDRRLLAPSEIKQLKYWEPLTIGEIVFNRWD